MKRFKPFTINLRGRLYSVDRPQVMAILNTTDNSFYAPSRIAGKQSLIERASRMIADGADMLDIGACSTRPGSVPPDPATECRAISEAIPLLREHFPEIPISVDTYRASVAEAAVNAGADIINDIAGGQLDERMFDTVAALKVPYILTHTRGTPATMQSMTDYNDVVADVISELSHKVEQLRLRGVCDIIADPGLGFAKTVEQNYMLLDAIPLIESMLECPVLIGASRKRMLTSPLSVTPEEALNATTVVNTLAIDRGAAILRVHDPLEARQVVTISALMPKSKY